MSYIDRFLYGEDNGDGIQIVAPVGEWLAVFINGVHEFGHRETERKRYVVPFQRFHVDMGAAGGFAPPFYPSASFAKDVIVGAGYGASVAADLEVPIDNTGVVEMVPNGGEAIAGKFQIGRYKLRAAIPNARGGGNRFRLFL